MPERSRASIKQANKDLLGINTSTLRSLITAHLFTHLLAVTGTVFHGRIRCKVVSSKMVIRPQQASMPTSQIAQGFLEKAGLIYKDFRKNALQAYIKCKAYYDKQAKCPKPERKDYVYVLQLKTDHQVSTITFTELRWIGPYVIEKALPNNNYLVRKIVEDKTQVPLYFRLFQFSSGQPINDVQTTLRALKLDPESRKSQLHMMICTHVSVNMKNQPVKTILIKRRYPIHRNLH